jgi:plastocyanin
MQTRTVLPHLLPRPASRKFVWKSCRCYALFALVLLSATGAVGGATVQVGVGNDSPSFSPRAVSIQVGDTVQWNWGEPGFNHTVTSGSNGTASGLFESGLHQSPFTFSFTFPNAGTFDYFCKVHFSMGMTGTVTVSASQPPASQPLNISTRLRVETGANVMIGGFIVTGSVSKKVIVRAIGPSLAEANVTDVLADPVLELRAADGSLVKKNDNWKETQQAEIEATGVAPKNELESALVAPLNPGNYTAIVSGQGERTGVGLVEVYDLDQPADARLANISTRGLVQTGTNVMIGGFILGNGTGNANVIVRGIGPSLTQAGVSGALANPVLELRDGNGVLVQNNDDWKATQRAQIEATGVAPKNDLESALVATLAPGAYTAIVAGKDSGTGVGLVEVFRLQ